MSSASQKLFKTIVLHNKLMAEADLDALLQKTPEPDQVVRTMVARKIVAEALGAQLLALYRRKLEGLAPAKTPARAEPAAPGPAPAEPQAKPAPVAVVPPESAAVPPPQTTPPMAFETIQVGGDPVDIRHGGKELLHRLLAIARQANASDLHLKSDARPVVRVAALLRDIAMPPIPAAIVRETLLSALDDPQKEIFTRTNDLDFCYDAGPELGRFRTNYLVQHRGLDGIFRIINRRIPSLDELKLPPQIRRFCDYRQGLVLVTGPRACGKTTTLAALIDLINASRPAHIITIEDPIEFVHPCKKGHVNQRAVGPHTHSFSNALRATLREAPDVIMVGEMRDMETASLAITAAAMGTLVYATLHTPDAVRTVGRVLDAFPPAKQPQIRAMFAESLRGISAQLLIPGTDGKSMELATEILFNTPAIANMIRENRVSCLRGTMATGKKHGMVTLDESLAKLAQEGKITKADALARAENPAYMEKALAAVS